MPYDYRTNMKAKRNSQGTLFQGGKSERTDAARYPRGYTPSRQADVSSALSKTTLPEGRNGAFVREALSRSTIPANDMTGLKSITAVGKTHDPAHPRLGVYFPARKEMQIVPPTTHSRANRRLMQTSLTPETNSQDAAMNLVHEMGHHVDNKTNVTSKRMRAKIKGGESIRYGTPEAKGLSEGFADRHMLNHYRQDPRDTAKRGKMDPIPNTYYGRGKADGMPTYFEGMGLKITKKNRDLRRPEMHEQGRLF